MVTMATRRRTWLNVLQFNVENLTENIKIRQLKVSFKSAIASEVIYLTELLHMAVITPKL